MSTGPENPFVSPAQQACDVTIAALQASLISARIKHKRTDHTLAALQEEVGELAEAMLCFSEPGREGSVEAVIKEALQVAAVALRIVEEGDASFNLLPGKHGECYYVGEQGS